MRSVREGAVDPGLFAGYALDLDGTVYLGAELLPGAARTIAALRALGRSVVFLSNKPLDSRDRYAALLTRLGVPATADEIVNSSGVMVDYLLAHRAGQYGSGFVATSRAPARIASNAIWSLR